MNDDAHVVNLTIAYCECEPDGSVCTACGETCYSRQVEMRIHVAKFADSTLALCGSCYDIIEDDK